MEKSSNTTLPKKIIPNALNNFIFERVKAPKIDDRKVDCIALILTTLRSSICRQLSRCSNMKLFNAFGINTIKKILLYRARLGCVNFNHAASPIEENV
jgi:hypothetical protein